MNCLIYRQQKFYHRIWIVRGNQIILMTVFTLPNLIYPISGQEKFLISINDV